MQGIDVVSFDQILRLESRGLLRPASIRNFEMKTLIYRQVINSALGKYYKQRIRPYFKFVHETEIDETKVGAEIYK